MFIFCVRWNLLEVRCEMEVVSFFWGPQMPRMKNPNPFSLGTLKKILTERETEDMFNSIKWVMPGTYH